MPRLLGPPRTQPRDVAFPRASAHVGVSDALHSSGAIRNAAGRVTLSSPPMAPILVRAVRDTVAMCGSTGFHAAQVR
jgi:hypothetical protein